MLISFFTLAENVSHLTLLHLIPQFFFFSNVWFDIICRETVLGFPSHDITVRRFEGQRRHLRSPLSQDPQDRIYRGQYGVGDRSVRGQDGIN